MKLNQRESTRISKDRKGAEIKCMGVSVLQAMKKRNGVAVATMVVSI